MPSISTCMSYCRDLPDQVTHAETMSCDLFAATKKGYCCSEASQSGLRRFFVLNQYKSKTFLTLAREVAPPLFSLALGSQDFVVLPAKAFAYFLLVSDALWTD